MVDVLKVFDTMVKQIFYYGSELWGYICNRYTMVTREYLKYTPEWNEGVYYKYSSVIIVYLFYIIVSQAIV